ncbi:MAG TPA: hypothetical protein VH393_15880 [Ktedonobacterales bacterium]|jgi:hypothetical protein
MVAGDATEGVQDSAECWSCLSLSGGRRISPGPFIHEGRYWMVDHAYPTRLSHTPARLARACAQAPRRGAT